MSQEETFKCRVPLKAEGMTLVGYLSSRFTYYVESDWEKLVDAGKVAVNAERPVESQRSLKAGDEILYFSANRSEPKVPTKIPVVYEDEDLIVVNKPAHLPVHPAGKYSRNTLINLLKIQKKND